MARPEVPDTSVLIATLRTPDRWPALQRSFQSGRFWLSSVVVAEMYAGTRSPDDATLIDRIVSVVSRVDRLLVPSAADWARAGRLIARRIRLQGDLRPRDHFADVVILMSAASVGGTVVTENLRHFEAWARLAVASGLDVEVRPSGTNA